MDEVVFGECCQSLFWSEQLSRLFGNRVAFRKPFSFRAVRAGEVARKSFRVRAGSDTAGLAPAPSDRNRAAKALDKAAKKTESDGGGKKRKASENQIDRAKRRAEGAKRSRNRPRNKDRGKGFERN
ncbi:hypothetical protein DXV76_21055 [Rhodobacteraceae bacterium CCMM004]|nr:hypothetical protein DXV76_21055 [Rhodobacteraceae bacterium CCMM004]